LSNSALAKASLLLASLAKDPSLQKLLGSFAGLRRQLSRRLLLVDFSDGCAVVVQCRLRGSSVDLLPIDITELPPEAVEKGCPTEPDDMAALLRSVIDERKIVAQRAAVVLPASAFTTIPLCIEAELSPEQALQQLGEAGAAVQLPFPRQQADLALVDITDPVDRATHLHHSYLLMAVQRSNTDRLVSTFKAAGLELQFVDSGLLAPLRLLDQQIKALQGDQQLLHLGLSQGFTSCTTVWRGGPQKVQRLAPVRPYPLQRQSDDDYFPITPEDLLSLLRDLRKLIKESANTTSLITLGGISSGHPGIEELISDALELPVQLVRPLQHPSVGSFELPAGYNPQLFGRIVGMALRCLHADQNAAALAAQQPRPKPRSQSLLQLLKARIKSNIGK